MRKLRLHILVVTFLFSIASAISWYYLPGGLKVEKVVFIPPRSSLHSIGILLKENKIVNSAFLLKAFAVLTRHHKHLKAGEYQFTSQMSPAEVIGLLVSGRVLQHPFTVVEGETSQQVVEKLLKFPNLSGSIETIPEEGTLLPETYSFVRGMDRKRLIEEMQKAMDKKTNAFWAQRPQTNFPLNSLKDLIILASIVEKETSLPQERPIVAAVFLNRLRLGMPLQADPTVAYGIRQVESLDRDLTQKDLKHKNPYNTYITVGLPKGPIANPGHASLYAVIYPADVDYLYFVADGTGGHVFSSTLKEHKKNHQAWRKIRSQYKK